MLTKPEGDWPRKGWESPPPPPPEPAYYYRQEYEPPPVTVDRDMSWDLRLGAKDKIIGCAFITLVMLYWVVVTASIAAPIIIAFELLKHWGGR
jgi:hypothetical protein